MRKGLATGMVSMVCGFALGQLILPSFGGLEKASLDSPSLNSYDALPCPTPSEFLDLIQKISYKDDAFSCDENSNQKKMAQLLFFASNLNFEDPRNWGGAIAQDLKSPWTYILSMNTSISYDSTLQRSIAQSDRRGALSVGPLFFELPPLEALSILIHESRHSAQKDPGHEICLLGDIPKTAGGCDTKFNLDEFAGAYSYSVVFDLMMALFNPSIPEVDRIEMGHKALLKIGTRFNEVPKFFAQPYDVLYFLDRQGLHQLLPQGQTQRIDTQDLDIERIEFNPMNNGIFIFTTDKKIFTYSLDEGLRPLYPDLISENLRLMDANKVYLPQGSYAYMMFITEDKRILYKDIDLQTGASSLRLYPRRGGSTPTRIFFGELFSAFLLTESHQIIYLAPSRRNTEQVHPGFNASAHQWMDVYGGLLYDTLYAIDQNGSLFNGNSSNPSIPFSNFTLKKYREGLTARFAQSRNGGLFIQKYGPREEIKELNLDVVDFAVGRGFTLDPQLAHPK